MTDNRDSLDFKTEPVGRLFRKMFLPTLIGMVSMVVLNITDGAFVGHGVSSDALAAINIVAPIYLIAGGIGLMFGIGSSVVASIHLSKGNTKAANINLTQGIMASTLFGLVLALTTFFFQESVCHLFGCSDALLPLACQYLKWVSLLTPFNMFGMTGMFMVRLDGSPRYAMVVNCSMAITNIVLDYILIFPLQMGIEGAAIATTIAFSLGNIPLFYYFFCKAKSVHLYRLKLSATSLQLTLRNLAYQMKIGVSGLLGDLAIAAVMIVGNFVYIKYLGEDGVAAYSVGCYCLPIVFMMGNAIMQSVQPIISFAHGTGEMQRLHAARRIALRAAGISGLLGMLFMWFGSGFISGTFLPANSHAYQLCVDGLPLFSSAFFFIAINIVLVGYLQSIEAATKATLFTLLRGFIFSIPIFIVLPSLIGVSGLWLALPLTECITTLIMFIVLWNK